MEDFDVKIDILCALKASEKWFIVTLFCYVHFASGCFLTYYILAIFHEKQFSRTVSFAELPEEM